MTYDSTTSPERQDNPWSCSVRTATWLLRALGIATDYATVRGQMVPGLATPDLGLLQGDGAGLARFLGEQTGYATGHAWPTWAAVQALAAQGPLGLGSGSLYHWVAVRGVNADGSLTLMNPAPGYQGLWDTMSEAQFTQWSPWAAVYFALPQEDDLSAEERTELEDLRNYIGGLTADVLTPALAAIEAAAQGQRGARWDQVRAQVAAVRQGSGITA